MKIKADVLIVEDVEEMRLMLEQLVNSMSSFKVSGSSSNVAEARLELTRRRPSLVLLDEILPGESSTDLLDELVEQGIAVVLMTGMEDPRHELPLGACARLSKPGWRTLGEDTARIEIELLKALQLKLPVP